MNKLIFIDTETTGLSPDEHGVIQVAMLYNDKELNLKVNPLPLGVAVDKAALEVHGVKKKAIKKLGKHKKQFKKMIEFMDDIVDKYNTYDKLIAVGYNVKFDVEMLHGWAKREDFNYLGSYIDWRVIDVLTLVRTAQYLGQVPGVPVNYKLATICETYGIDVPGHDALDDIRATRELFFKIINNWRFPDEIPF